MPLTIQTSPFQVQMAAEWPSGKKSNPLVRSQALPAGCSGSVIVSTVYGSLSSPVWPTLTAGSPQRRGPPLVRAAKFDRCRAAHP